MASWIEDAEAALKGETRDGVTSLTPNRPPVLDPAGVRAVLAPFLAMFMWAAVAYRKLLATAPMDPLSLLLFLLALALTVRSVVAAALLVRRWRAWSATASYGLAITNGGLLYRHPEGDVAIARDDIVDIREHGDWRKRSGRRWAHVYLVTRPDSGRLYLAIPPFFGGTPGQLAERLMRWRGVVEAPEGHEPAEAMNLPSKLFDQVAAGERPMGIAVIEHGWGWLRRGPYATILLGVAVLITWLRLPAISREAIGPAAPFIILFSLGIVPIVWFQMTRFDIRPRKGIALIITAGEILMRTRSGVHRVPWTDLIKAEVSSRTIWSLLQGQHDSRALVLNLVDEDKISYVEAFLGAPAEVVLALCEAYRKGVLP